MLLTKTPSTTRRNRGAGAQRTASTHLLEDVLRGAVQLVSQEGPLVAAFRQLVATHVFPMQNLVKATEAAWLLDLRFLKFDHGHKDGKTF